MTGRLLRVLVASAILAGPARGQVAAPEAAAGGPGLEPGRIHERVAALADPAQSFALYVPVRPDGGRRLPVLFLFDPAARGPLAVSKFREAADKYGWIVVASNDAHNGPSEPIVGAARTMWSEARRRLAVDERRVYAGGFSGGARAASYFAQVTGAPVAGIIACGAGLSQGLEPAGLKPAFWFGLVGLSDFNYREMKGLDATLDAAGVGHGLLVFDGRHDWPEPALCARAVGRLEVQAMKAGWRPRDEALVDELLRAETAEADAFEAADRIAAAAGRVEAARALLEGLRETKDVEDRLAALRARREYERELKAEARRDAREAETRSGFIRAFAEIQGGPPGGPRLQELQREMQLHFLRSEAEKAKRPEDRALASRILFDLCYNADAKAMEYYDKKDLARTSAFLELALAACEETNPRAKYLYYDLACVAALRGDAKQALKDLAAAVDKGFSDAGLLETSRPLESIRGTPEFQRILDGLKSRPGREPGAGH